MLGRQPGCIPLFGDYMHKAGNLNCNFGPQEPKEGWANVNTLLLKLYIKIHDLTTREDGQDLVEYTMMVDLLSFGWVASVKSVAIAVVSAFESLSTSLSSYVS